MDHVDRLILDQIQLAFPLDLQPYEHIGKTVGITEHEAWQRVDNLRRRGIIRRIGGIFDSRSLGYVSTLCTAKVPEDKIPVLAKLMKGITEITHNYLRDHEKYNMWFTVIASSQDRLDEILNLIRTTLESNEVHSLPATKLFKIGVYFHFNKKGTNEKKDQLHEGIQTTNNDLNPYPVTDEDKHLIRLLQEDIPSSIRPFNEIAQELRVPESQVIRHTQHFLSNQVMRRLGAVLVHHKAGFTSNAMGVWIVPEERVMEAGIIMAEFPEVSHCYQRPTLPDWPYNVFTMIHGQNNQECEQIMERLSQASGVKNYRMLYSRKELKKSSMRYFL